MNAECLEFIPKKTFRSLMSFFMAVVFVFSNIANVFAEMPAGYFYFTSVQINDGQVIESDVSDLTSGGNFGTAAVDENVPVYSTFKITCEYKVFLNAPCWDPETDTLSATKINREMVIIQTLDGQVVDGVEVSNDSLLQGYNASDRTINVRLMKPLNYDTNYQLVLKKYFAKVNKYGEPKGGLKEDVIIPFKTAVRQKPTITKAELRGTSLRLEGLPKNENLAYNFAVDGQFDDANWKEFSYTDDTANIEVQNMNLTSNSKIIVGYPKEDNSPPSVVSDPIPVLYASSGAPSFTGAVLNGKQLTLNGLPKNASNMEYRIAADGQNYGEWNKLAVAGTTSDVDVTGLNLVQGKSMIQVRYKASPPWSASETTEKSFDYGVGVKSPLTVGQDTLLIDGIKVTPVSLNTPSEGEENSVTVRGAEGEKLAVDNNMGFIEGVEDSVKSAGGIYGFNLKGAGDGANNHVKITIPYQLPTLPEEYKNFKLDSSNVSIYILSPYNFGGTDQNWQYWKLVPTAIDEINQTATVDITGFDTKGKEIILGVKFDIFSPSAPTISKYARTADSISLLLSAADLSGIKEIEIERVNRKDSNDKKTEIISYKEYPKLSNPPNSFENSWVVYTDTDPKPGVNYDYVYKAATDMLGNRAEVGGLACSATLDSMEALVQQAKNSILENLKEVQSKPNDYPRIIFAGADDQNSVSQGVELPTTDGMKTSMCHIEWTCDRPDIIKISPFGRTEIHPPVDEQGNPGEAVVNLVGTINGSFGDRITKTVEKAVDTITIPITVKWKVINGEVLIETKYDAVLGDGVRTSNNAFDELVTALKFDDAIAKTIVLKHTAVIQNKTDDNGVFIPQDIVIDGHGKTIKADFDGSLFRSGRSGAVLLKNVVIDMNHKSGRILGSTTNKITFENVKVINAENCDYGVILDSTIREGKSFTAQNCEFSNFKVAAIAALNSQYDYTDTYYKLYYKYVPIPVSIRNCTFDGGGKPGYAIVDAFGDISIENTTFKGYKGNVSTGWNSTNDSYQHTDNYNTYDSEGENYYLYKGIPDSTASAAVLVKEVGSASLNNNTISDCDNSVMVWTAEKKFNFLYTVPDSNFTAYSKVNGITVDSSTAGQVVESLLQANTINKVQGSESNNVVVQDAADRYNRNTILSKATELDTTAPDWPEGSTVKASNIKGKSLTLSWSAAQDNKGVTAYKIYKNNILIGTVKGNVTSYNVTGLTQNTQYTFKITAGDASNNWSTKGPSITVKTLNTVFNSIGNKTAYEGKALSFIVSAVHPDGSALTYSVTGLPKGASFNTKTKTFSWTPGYTQAGVYYVKFTVSDGKAAVSKVIAITVKNTNRAPQFTTITNKTVKEGQKLSFALYVRDLDGDRLTYSVAGVLPKGASFNVKTKTFSWTPSYTQTGTYKVKFLVKDGTTAVSQMVSIVVKNVK